MSTGSSGWARRSSSRPAPSSMATIRRSSRDHGSNDDANEVRSWVLRMPASTCWCCSVRRRSERDAWKSAAPCDPRRPGKPDRDRRDDQHADDARAADGGAPGERRRARGEQPHEGGGGKQVPRVEEHRVAVVEERVGQREAEHEGDGHGVDGRREHRQGGEGQEQQRAPPEQVFAEGSGALARHAQGVVQIVAIAAQARGGPRVLHGAAHVGPEAQAVARRRPVRAREVERLGGRPPRSRGACCSATSRMTNGAAPAASHGAIAQPPERRCQSSTPTTAAASTAPSRRRDATTHPTQAPTTRPHARLARVEREPFTSGGAARFSAPAIARAASTATNACERRSAVSSARPMEARESRRDTRVASSPASGSPAARPRARPSDACASTSATATAGPTQHGGPDDETNGAMASGQPGGRSRRARGRAPRAGSDRRRPGSGGARAAPGDRGPAPAPAQVDAGVDRQRLVAHGRVRCPERDPCGRQRADADEDVAPAPAARAARGRRSGAAAGSRRGRPRGR